MSTATKVVFNTLVLYAKILLTMAISLITVPMVLHALGQSDYGLYSLVGGIIAMLAFLNNSMSVATQRFMSVAMGKGNLELINQVFNVNIKLHFFIGLIVVVLLELIGLLSFDRLNIEPESVVRAKIIFQFLIITTFVNIICVPLNGVINAREDMVVFSIIGVIDSLLALGVAAMLSHVSCDKLLFYGLGMMFLPIITLILTFLFVRKAYPEYKIDLKKRPDKGLFKETFGFAGWNLLGAIALMCRNQGTAVIINLFLGTIANASYGIANQINGALNQFSSTFQKAINPQLMKSEGMNDRQRMHKIAFTSSKFGVLALSLVAIPVILEMPEILRLWLRRDIPPFTIQLSQLILLLSIVTQFSMGLMSEIQATGHIRNYQIVMSLIILLCLPASYMLLKWEYPIYYVTGAFVLLEMVALAVRIYMAHRITGMVIGDYFKQVVYPTLIIIGVSFIASLLPHFLMRQSFVRVFVTGLIFAMSFLLLFWCVALDKEQKESICTFINKKKQRFSNGKNKE